MSERLPLEHGHGVQLNLLEEPRIESSRRSKLILARAIQKDLETSRLTGLEGHPGPLGPGK